ncbi:MAG: HNH endonuclease, partial [Candidatus Zixiibacteriota bacterium]
MTRKPIPSEVQKEVLVSSRRRCAVCFGLYGDTKVKKGQIAHLDQDNTNTTIENLVFLCLKHHDEYDSRTSQSKGFTDAEVKKYREELYTFVKDQPLAALVDYPVIKGKKVSKRPSFSVEVYDRRIVVYRIVRDCLGEIFASATISLEKLQEFARGTDEAIFLFDRDVAEYLRELYQAANRLRYIDNRLRDERLPVG